MHSTVKYLSTACASALLLACADLGRLPAPSGPTLAAAGSANAAYAAGRAHHLAGKVEAAEAAYWDALRADPTHVNARNGLASVHAERGDLARAIPIWRALTANATLGSGPGAAFLFGNLGFAYLRAGDYPNAQQALEKACLLDPLKPRSWQHLGEALQKQGQDERAQQMFRQAAALREHDLRADYVATGAASPVAAIAAAVEAPTRDEPEWGATEVHAAADGMLELRRIPAPATSAAVLAQATPAAQPAQEPGPAPAPGDGLALPAIARLEIRNGNGVTGMARALSRQLADPALKVVRLSNEKGFRIRMTRVEYQPAYRDAAERLAERLGSARAVEVQNFKSSHLRLVIGHDLKGKFAMRPVVRPPQAPALAQLAQP